MQRTCRMHRMRGSSEAAWNSRRSRSFLPNLHLAGAFHRHWRHQHHRRNARPSWDHQGRQPGWDQLWSGDPCLGDGKEGRWRIKCIVKFFSQACYKAVDVGLVLSPIVTPRFRGV